MKKVWITIIAIIAVLGIGVLGFTSIFTFKSFDNEPSEATATNEVVSSEEVEPNKEEPNNEEQQVETLPPLASIKAHQVIDYEFKEPVDGTTLTNERVLVKDKDGNNVAVTYTLSDSETILSILPPSEGYAINEEYSLQLKRGITFKSGSAPEKEVQQPFTVIADEESSEDSSTAERNANTNDSSIEKPIDDNLSQNNSTTETSAHPLNGEWSRNVQNNEGTLTISNATDTSFDFSLQITSGGEYGDVKGKATVKGNTATYTDVTDDSGCQLTFALADKSIAVTQNKECQQFHGPHISFEGTYDKGAPQVKVKTLADQGILTKEEDADIQELVGDNYNLLLESTTQYYDGKDIDGLDAKVIYGSAPGLNKIRQSIIMVDAYGYYYVGLILNGNTVRLYTTNSSFKDTLPKTVEEWRQPFKEYPVDFYYTSLRAK
ncbi:hypothetical protein CN918_31000 [Priestia megaterium]|nr:hypothetical protein CN918_31000 [Priestia megaterium]